MSEHLEPVTVDATLCDQETEKAIRVVVDDEAHWVPKSVILDDSEVYKLGTSGTLVVSGWFAKKKGWE